jgi:hypothetical protein
MRPAIPWRCRAARSWRSSRRRGGFAACARRRGSTASWRRGCWSRCRRRPPGPPNWDVRFPARPHAEVRRLDCAVLDCVVPGLGADEASGRRPHRARAARGRQASAGVGWNVSAGVGWRQASAGVRQASAEDRALAAPGMAKQRTSAPERAGCTVTDTTVGRPCTMQRCARRISHSRCRAHECAIVGAHDNRGSIREETDVLAELGCRPRAHRVRAARRRGGVVLEPLLASPACPASGTVAFPRSPQAGRP